jgi:serine phosphatase RsbU (regulator of sigma subunit)
VVSGDFYFVREYDNRLIVACCDCTGHGVPGAFMSMIGATTLRNIYKMMESSGEWKTPEKVLEKLDDEIQKILHQQEFESSDSDDMLRSGDGMDLTIAEIHIKTKEVLLASAKRHSFIRQNGKIEIISGDKRAIGGADILKTPFQLLRFKVAENDALFIFSDGYPDQFGGADDRKLKLSGTSEILSKLKELPKDEYSKSVKSAFEQWQGDFDQIDDVLFMGILF